jgi:group I intron endonuclease
MDPQIISGLYRIKNNINGKCYIGLSSHGAARRFAAHVKAMKRGSMTALHCAMRKYGVDAFSVEQLVFCEPGPHLKEMEVQAIASHQTRAPSGYNLTAGGDGVVNGSPEVREKIKRARAANPPVLTAAGKKAIAAGSTRAWADPVHRATRIESIKRGLNDPTVHTARCAAIQCTASSTEGRAIKRAVAAELWATPDYRNKVVAASRAGVRTPEARINRARAAKEAWAKRKAT